MSSMPATNSCSRSVTFTSSGVFMCANLEGQAASSQRGARSCLGADGFVPCSGFLGQDVGALRYLEQQGRKE